MYRSSSGISQCWPVSALDHNLRFRLGEILCVRSTFSCGFKVFFSVNETVDFGFQLLKKFMPVLVQGFAIDRNLWFQV